MRLSRPTSARFVLAAPLVAAALALGAGTAGAAPPVATQHRSHASARPAASTSKTPSCSGVTVVSLTTALVTSPAAMQLDLTLSRGVGTVFAYVGGEGGVAEAGALGPVAGSPGSYAGLFVPPSGVPVAEGAQVVITACSGRLTVGTSVGSSTWTTGGGRPTATPPTITTTTTEPTDTPTTAACSGAQITRLAASLTDGGGVQVTLEVSKDVGPAASAYVVSASVPGAAGVKAGTLPETSPPGTYQGVITPPGGGAAGEIVEVGVCSRLRAHTTVGSSSWAAGGISTEPTSTSGTTPTTTTPPTTTPPVRTTEAAGGCAGAVVTGVSSSLASDGTGVVLTITVNHSLGRPFSSAVESDGKMVAEGSVPELSGQPGTYQATLESTSGAPIPSGAVIVFGSCGGTGARLAYTTAVGSSTWSPLAGGQ